ncbi:MAG: hypothetical protein ABII23_07275, partial [bacterium]
LWGNSTSVMTHTSGDANWQYILIGMYYGNILGIDSSARSAKVYYDDVYIDNTQTRVEIGDKQTWNSCTQREIQMPTAWSDTSIAITVNRGSFDQCKTYYLYVVDANGNVNTNGFPIPIVPAADEPPCPLRIFKRINP